MALAKIRVKLIEATNLSPKVIHCYAPTGLLTYTASGYVAVGFNCMQEKNSTKPDYNLDNMTFYTGRYKVIGNNVIHIIVNGSSPAYYHQKLVRHIDLLTDKKLVLSLTQDGRRISVGWDRVG